MSMSNLNPRYKYKRWFPIHTILKYSKSDFSIMFVDTLDSGGPSLRE